MGPNGPTMGPNGPTKWPKRTDHVANIPDHYQRLRQRLRQRVTQRLQRVCAYARAPRGIDRFTTTTPPAWGWRGGPGRGGSETRLGPGAPSSGGERDGGVGCGRRGVRREELQVDERPGGQRPRAPGGGEQPGQGEEQ